MKVDNLYIVMFPNKSDIRLEDGEVYNSGKWLFAKYSLKCKSTETYVVKTLGGPGPSKRGKVVQAFMSGDMHDFTCEKRLDYCSGGFVTGGSVGVYAVFHCDSNSMPALFDALQSQRYAQQMDQDVTAQAFVRVLHNSVGVAKMDKLVLVACNSAHHTPVQGSMSFLDRVCAVLEKDDNPPCIVGWDGSEFVYKDGSKTSGSDIPRSEQRSERKWIAAYVPGQGYQQKRYEPHGWSASQHVQTEIGPACIPL
jgi:hypothetical protein